MRDEYFGIKELYEVVLKAKTPMRFGSRYLEEGEPVLYFENINMSLLTEQSSPIMALHALVQEVFHFLLY